MVNKELPPLPPPNEELRTLFPALQYLSPLHLTGSLILHGPPPTNSPVVQAPFPLEIPEQVRQMQMTPP